MSFRPYSLLLPLLAAGGCAQDPNEASPAAAAQPPATPTDFMRYVHVDDEHGRLEVQLVRYKEGDGRVVTLVPAVHVADATHYDELNRRFRGFDALLYELIAQADDRPRPGQRGGALSAVQRAITNGLGVEFQLDGIDYQAENFVHADLTPQEFTRLQQERGESLVTLLWKAMTSAQLRPEEDEEEGEGGAAGTARPKPPDLVKALREGRGPWALKLMLAPEFEQIERMAAGFEEDSDGKPSVLLGARNERAITVLQQELRRHRNLAIYYGAAHMPDMERRLLALGFATTGSEWLPVWDIKPPSPAKQGR